jgi:hypothetical protein
MGLVRRSAKDMSHDGIISCRRFYASEELMLLARLGSWGDTAKATWTPPRHALLQLHLKGGL